MGQAWEKGWARALGLRLAKALAPGMVLSLASMLVPPSAGAWASMLAQVWELVMEVTLVRLWAQESGLVLETALVLVSAHP